MVCVLGLDISTSCTGLAVLDADTTSLVYLSSESFKGCENLWQKADRMRDRFVSLKKDLHIDHVYVEQSLLMFRPGMSSAATIAALTSFNGLVSYLSREVFCRDPNMVPSTTARKKCGIRVLKSPASTLPAKEQVFVWATQDNGPLHDYVFEKTKTGKFKPNCYDMVDAYVIARAGCVLLNEPTVEHQSMA